MIRSKIGVGGEGMELIMLTVVTDGVGVEETIWRLHLENGIRKESQGNTVIGEEVEKKGPSQGDWEIAKRKEQKIKPSKEKK